MRDVDRVHETAITFRGEDPATRHAQARVRQDLRERYHVDVLETGADPAVVRATLVDRMDAGRRPRSAHQRSRDTLLWILHVPAMRR